jgi:gamma-glutamylaminecyclotransferase
MLFESDTFLRMINFYWTGSQLMQLFVYGTLKEGQSRSSQLIGRRITAKALTRPDYQMYRLDGYPGLIEVQPGKGVSIIGELWEIDPECLQRIDVLEGVNEGDYERRPIRLACPLEGYQVDAYFYLNSVADREDCGRSW